MYWDSTYILVIIGAIISMIASANVHLTFQRYAKTFSSRGFTAEEVARRILNSAGIYDVSIEPIHGNLTDHYSPSEKVLRLSQSVYGQRSVAAIGVAAHECGHAIQHKEDYGPLRLRSASVPLANIGSRFSWIVIFVGLIFSWMEIARIGVLLFSFVVFFQLITLPVEFNASNRAIRVLESEGILDGTELAGAKKVLSAAALTYVAALLSSILQMLRLILIIQGRDSRRRH